MQREMGFIGEWERERRCGRRRRFTGFVPTTEAEQIKNAYEISRCGKLEWHLIMGSSFLK